MNRLTSLAADSQHSTRRAFLLAAAVFVAALASCLQAAHQRGDLSSPPRSDGDESSYHELGQSLAAGHGFVYQTNSPQGELVPTAYRPPGFPMVVAAIYSVSPANYFLVRLTNAACCALAIACVSFAFTRQVSLLCGVGVGVLGCIDPRLREFAGTFLTENLATLMLSLFVLATTWFLNCKNYGSAFVSGLSFSGLVFVRSFFVAWYPVIWLYIAWLLYRDQPRCDDSRQRYMASRLLATFAMFALSSLILTGPWWVRNCVVLKAIMPTGTQGGIGIADGFSDSAYENQGDWKSTTADRIAAQMHRDRRYQDLSAIEFEREHCRLGAISAKTWISANPEKLPLLTWWKVSKLWGWDAHIAHKVFFGFALLGLVTLRKHPLGRVTCLLLVLNTLTVMATYYTYERFITPFRPLLHGMACSGLVWLIGMRRGFRKHQLLGEPL